MLENAIQTWSFTADELPPDAAAPDNAEDYATWVGRCKLCRIKEGKILH
jgi:hypothetical protein